MTASRYVLDSNIITAILRKERAIAEHMAVALRSSAEFLICPVVFYEVYRGLLHRDAKKQLSFFLQYVKRFTWEEITRDDWETAAHRWAKVRSQGYQADDADLLIAVYADRRGAAVVTDNAGHFAPLGVQFENWRR